jgi:hypothetical protein
MKTTRLEFVLCSVGLALIAPANAEAYTKPIPLPLNDGVYASHCGDPERDDSRARQAGFTLSGKTFELWWTENGTTEEFACKIRTRTMLKASKSLPRAEAMELSCINNGEEADNFLYLRSWRMRESEVSSWSEGSLTLLFTHYHWASKPRLRIDEISLAKCVENE